MIRGDGPHQARRADPILVVRRTEGLRSALKTGIVSVGYEGHDLETFVDLLLRHDVATLADVRLNAISRRVGFSKTKLSMSVADAGIKYLHLKSLGNPKDNRDAFHRGRMEEGVAKFKEVLSHDEAKSAIDALVTRAQTEVVAIMCFESDHLRCHRDVIIGELAVRAGASIMYL